jgi:effector-binding domain-containing protein
MDIKEREIKRVKHNVIHLHVDDAWKKEIERLAEATGETISETIRECVRLGAQAFHDKRSKRKPFAE